MSVKPPALFDLSGQEELLDVPMVQPAAPTIRHKIYVGISVETGKREVFKTEQEPTFESHGKIYACTIGPFRSSKAARFMAEYGSNNPHVQCVADAERIVQQIA